MNATRKRPPSRPGQGGEKDRLCRALIQIHFTEFAPAKQGHPHLPDPDLATVEVGDE